MTLRLRRPRREFLAIITLSKTYCLTDPAALFPALVRHRRSREGAALRRRPLVSRSAGDKGSHRFHRRPPSVVSRG
jgi:hypothetical protein